MNIEELNEKVKNNQKRNLEKTIKDIERSITWRASNGLNNIEIATDGDSYDFLYTINKWMLEPLKDYFISNDYKVTVKEINPEYPIAIAKQTISALSAIGSINVPKRLR